MGFTAACLFLQMRKLRPGRGVGFVEGCPADQHHSWDWSQAGPHSSSLGHLHLQPCSWISLLLCVLYVVSGSGTDPRGLPAFHPPALLVYVHVNGPLQAGPAAGCEPASHLELRLPQNVYGARSRNETTSILLTAPKHCTHSWPAC